MVGQKIGRLTVLTRGTGLNPKETYWYCQCECGNYITTTRRKLRSKNTRSCGCLAKEKNVCQQTHGLAKQIPEYHIWCAMNRRCTNPNAPDYDRYGGRGITVCKQWKSFAQFLADMGRRPSKKHSLDRIDNDQDYNPENCRWALSTTQQNNKQNNKLITHNGQTHTLAEWSKITGIKPSTLSWRIRNNWPTERALKSYRPTSEPSGPASYPSP